MGIKISDPIGDPSYGPFLVRLPLGVYFIQSGIAKMNHPQIFLDAVKQYNEIKEPLATLYGVLSPYVEFVTGVFVLIGFWTTLAGILAALLSLSFFFALGTYKHMPWSPDFVVLSKPVAAAGVFPGYVPRWDVLLLAASLSLLYSGAGALSVDRFRKSG
jgi:uncharacterized membrane protein YphA (DoxX/SURF4 family)